MQEKSDIELIQAVRGNQDAEKAFRELYSRHSHRIYLYCLKILGDPKDAQDVFQDTFIRLHSAVQRGFEIRNVEFYLLKIARNRCLNHRRDRKPLTSLEEIHFAAHETNYEKEELLRLITMALELLEPDYREAFVLKEYQGLTYPQMAEITGASVSALKSRVWRAKEKIRVLLNPYLEDLERL